MRCQGTISDKVLKDKAIDEKYFVRRKRAYRKIWLQAHENYFFFSKHLIDSHIAKLLSLAHGRMQDWTSFLAQGLWTYIESITNVTIPKMLWLFYKYTTWAINYMFKLKKIPQKKRILAVLIER
jgi:hypothetical protein